MSTNRNRKKKPKNVKDHVTEPRPKRKSASASAETAQATRTSGQSKGAVQSPSAETGPDLWPWVLGAIAAATTAYAVVKHRETKEFEVAADQANKRASAHRAVAQTAKRNAQRMEAIAAKEHHRANLAEDRTRKLAMEVADHANKRIAELLHETAPPLRFDGCVAAATDGVEIRIDMAWILSGIVDSAKEEGAILGRMVGTIAHEWFHFQDTARGTRLSHEEELLADKFAGKQLAKLRVPPNHFADLLRVFPQSSTHPDGPLRAETMLKAWTKTQEREREAAEPITTIVTQPVTAAVQAPGRQSRNGAVKKSATKTKSTTKTGATKMSATKTSVTKITKTGTPKKRTAEKSTPKKISISASSNQ